MQGVPGSMGSQEVTLHLISQEARSAEHATCGQLCLQGQPSWAPSQAQIHLPL